MSVDFHRFKYKYVDIIFIDTYTRTKFTDKKVPVSYSRNYASLGLLERWLRMDWYIFWYVLRKMKSWTVQMLRSQPTQWVITARKVNKYQAQRNTVRKWFNLYIRKSNRFACRLKYQSYLKFLMGLTLEVLFWYSWREIDIAVYADCQLLYLILSFISMHYSTCATCWLFCVDEDIWEKDLTHTKD